MEIIKDIITSVLFYLLPLAAGMAILPKKYREKTGIVLPAIAYAVGLLLLYVCMLGFIPFISAIAPHISGAILFRYTSIVIGSISFVFSVIPVYQYIKMFGKQLTIPVAVSFILTIIAFAIWKYDSPYPLVLNWDILEHQTLVHIISNGSISVITSHLSDTFTFNGYTTLYHVLLAIPYSIVKPDPAGFWYVIEFFHAWLTVLLCFVVGKLVTKRTITGIIMAILGAFLFESYVATSSLFLVPQSFSAVLGIALTAYIISVWNKKEISLMAVIIFMMSIILTHYIIGSIAILTSLGLLLAKEMPILKHRGVTFLLGIIIPALMVLAALIVTRFINISTINGGEAAAFIFTPQKTWDFLRVFSGYTPLILFPVGVISLLLKKDSLSHVLGIAAISLATILFLPLPYMFKLLAFGRYIVLVPVAVLITESLGLIPSKIIKTVCLVMMMITGSMLLILNARYWKDSISTRGTASLVSPDELEAASWMKTNYGTKPGVILISDPATMYVLEAFSGINSPGGAYTSAENRKQLAILGTNPPSGTWNQAVHAVRDVNTITQPQTTLLAVSNRYFAWQDAGSDKQMDKSFNIWTPGRLTFAQKTDINSLIKSYSISKVYENLSLELFEIN